MTERVAMPETPLVVAPSTADQPTLIFHRDPTMPPNDASRPGDRTSAAVVAARDRFRGFVSELLQNARTEIVHFARSNYAVHGRGVVTFPHECIDDLMHDFKPRYVPLRNVTTASHGEQTCRMVQNYTPSTHIVFFMTLPITLEDGAQRLLFAPITIGPFTPTPTPTPPTCDNVNCPIKQTPSFDPHTSYAATPLKRCARCKIRHYCSPACQKADWTARHKSECTPTNV